MMEKSYIRGLLKILQPLLLIVAIPFLEACKNEDPTPENIPELITKVVLHFLPVGGGPTITVTATDPDGGGVQDIEVDGAINLVKSNQYTLSLELINELYLPGDEDYDITKAVQEEGEEHQFFFSFSDGIFSSPTGTGNVLENAGSTSGIINYLDTDEGGLPIGITTSWTTSNEVSSDKTFRIILKHQPEIKSTTSTSMDGESDLDISFVLNVN